MLRIFRVALIFLLPALFLLFLISPSFAQAPPTPNTSTQQANNSGAAFTTDPLPENINESVQNVEVSFHGLTNSHGGYVLCTGDTVCLKDEGFVNGLNGTKDSLITQGVPTANGTGDVNIKVCGDGQSKVKIEGNCPDNDPNNYFWGGNIYYMSLGTLDGSYYHPLKKGGFYVGRAYPKVSISPHTNLTTNSTINVKIWQDFPPRIGEKSRNNYQISMTGGEAYSQVNCVTITSQGQIGAQGDTYNNLTVGKYTLKINDQINDSHTGFNPLHPLGRNKDCSGGFTYYQVTCDVTNSGKDGGSCSGVDTNGIVTEQNKDPQGEEYKAFLSDLAELNKAGGGLTFPCGDGKTTVNNPTNCKTLNTAIGPIEVSVQGFITTIFKFVLTLAAFGGIIIIIYSGYMLMISRGDKEKIAGARETITAAIVGLLFIILSIVILEIIGIDILRIPGFSR